MSNSNALEAFAHVSELGFRGTTFRSVIPMMGGCRPEKARHKSKPSVATKKGDGRTESDYSWPRFSTANDAKREEGRSSWRLSTRAILPLSSRTGHEAFRLCHR